MYIFELMENSKKSSVIDMGEWVLYTLNNFLIYQNVTGKFVEVYKRFNRDSYHYHNDIKPDWVISY